MFYLEKILSTLMLPTGVSILLLILSVVLRKRALTVVALMVLWLSSTSPVSDVVMRAAEGWQVRQPIASAPNADAVVVLSGMVRAVPGASGTTEWTDAVDRIDAGVALAVAGKAPLLVFTAEWYPWDPGDVEKGRVLAERAVALGVPRERVVTTGRVGNTADEAKAVSELLAGRGAAPPARSVILVTSAHHMRRSRLLFERAGLSVAPFPVDFRTSRGTASVLDVFPQGGSLLKMDIALREFYGYLYYRFIKTR